MMVRAVLDTNVIVSAGWSEEGNCARILGDALDDRILLICSESIFEEYQDVLCRPKFNFSPMKVEGILSAIHKHALFVEVIPSTIPFLDEGDRKFYDAAKSAGAYLVTGNLRHYPAEPVIKSPTDFLRSW